MHDGLQNISLAFPLIPVGRKETSPDLTRLLYKGGASTRVDVVAYAIQQKQLGAILQERVDLVVKLHESISGKLAGGGSAR